MTDGDLKVTFTDNTDNGDLFIGTFIYYSFQGSIKTVEGFLSRSKEATHIGLLKEYGNIGSLVKVYPISQVLSIEKFNLNDIRDRKIDILI